MDIMNYRVQINLFIGVCIMVFYQYFLVTMKIVNMFLKMHIKKI
jgi:hypothetical protein